MISLQRFMLSNEQWHVARQTYANALRAGFGQGHPSRLQQTSRAVVIGRHVNPNYPASTPMLERLTSVPFDFTRCARCAGAVIDPPLRTGLL